MSNFEVKVVRIDDVVNTPNSDKLSNIRIGGFICVSAKVEEEKGVLKPRYNAGEPVVYIPEGSVVPEWILRRGFWNEKEGKGMLAGPNGDRVKAIRLRGQLSQGILYPVDRRLDGSIAVELADGSTRRVEIGADVADILGITKWEPEVPAHMAGQVVNIHGKTKGYDIENLKKYPDIFGEGESIVVTEKTHGTFTGLGYWPGLNHPELHRGDFFAYSKGNGAKGLVFKNTPENDNNVYHKVLKNFTTHDNHYYDEVMLGISMRYKGRPVFMFGETYGPGIQDLSYGVPRPQFAVFDIYVGTPEDGMYLDDRQLQYEIQFWHLPAVLELYRGSYDRRTLDKLKEGTTVFGHGMHVREGVVIRPVRERRHDSIGRVILKHVGDGYHTRGEDGTEYQ